MGSFGKFNRVVGAAKQSNGARAFSQPPNPVQKWALYCKTHSNPRGCWYYGKNRIGMLKTHGWLSWSSVHQIPIP
eukprot:scaffold207811_cov14-Tisochrysis_lutea.AAC.1